MADSLTMLANSAAEITMQGFVEFARVHKFEITDPDRACQIMRRHAKIRLSEALDDAREAFNANMHAIGRETFVCSMRQAGIDAAKEYQQA